MIGVLTRTCIYHGKKLVIITIVIKPGSAVNQAKRPGFGSYKLT